MGIWAIRMQDPSVFSPQAQDALSLMSEFEVQGSTTLFELGALALTVAPTEVNTKTNLASLLGEDKQWVNSGHINRNHKIHRTF